MVPHLVPRNGSVPIFGTIFGILVPVSVTTSPRNPSKWTHDCQDANLIQALIGHMGTSEITLIEDVNSSELPLIGGAHLELPGFHLPATDWSRAQDTSPLESGSRNTILAIFPRDSKSLDKYVLTPKDKKPEQRKIAQGGVYGNPKDKPPQGLDPST